MKRVVSVSLGSPGRNKEVVVSLGARQFLVQRIGVGSDFATYAKTLQDLDEDRLIELAYPYVSSIINADRCLQLLSTV